MIHLNNKSYYVSKTRKKKELLFFELDKVEGYSVTPKVSKDNQIEVSKIIFIDDEFSEKIIRKKIDKRIDYLLNQLKLIEDNDDGDETEDMIKRTIIDAEKLRMQIINKYVKYLGNTYHSLTLNKIQVITTNLRYKLYMINEMKNEIYNDYEERGRRGR